MRINSFSPLSMVNGRQFFSSIMLPLLLLSANGCHNTATENNNNTAIKIDTATHQQSITYNTPAVRTEIQITGTDTFEREATAYTIGDVNGDGIRDTATVHPPFFNDEDVCTDNDKCATFVIFSGTIPSIQKEITRNGFIKDLGDLDGDGRADIYFQTDCLQGTWRGFYVYCLRDNQWVEVASGAFNEEIEDGSKRVTKLSNGVIEITTDSLTTTDEGWVTVKRKVSITDKAKK